MPAPIRIVFADDSVTIRRFLQEALGSIPEIEIVGVGKNGQEAIGLVRRHRPDVLILDVEMPVMDGIDTVKTLRQFNTELPVIMFSSLTKSGGEATLDALAVGANAYAQKPTSGSGPDAALNHIREQLVPKIRQIAASAPSRKPAPAPCGKLSTASRSGGNPHVNSDIDVVETCRTPTSSPARPAAKKSTEPCRLVVIGSSTGGPNALATLLPMITSKLKVPILIAQHMPTVFTKLLAERLDRVTNLEVREAIHGETVKAGTILVAPGDYHLELKQDRPMPKLVLHQGPEENSCRPAVDVLFRSAAAVYRDKVLGIVLTGMGKDGTEGCRALNQAGSRVIAQDEASSVIWGMPRSVAQAGLADEVLPLDMIAAAIHKHSAGTPRAAVAAR
ncbi:MAG: chemotaxis response regulator protein-glutamate methylesterase [Fuerstiella sp.]